MIYVSTVTQNLQKMKMRTKFVILVANIHFQNEVFSAKCLIPNKIQPYIVTFVWAGFAVKSVFRRYPK